MTDYPEYRFYIGERIGNVSLWRRTAEDTEQPIMANTRGLTTWFSYDFDEYENTEPAQPTQAFWDALAALRQGAYEVDLAECEWYERELIHSLGEPAMTGEQEQLLEYAVEQSGPEGGASE
jgi:hypothetical protein